MASRYLIVNADDYNVDVERNLGILKAVRDGIVTSVTVIANTTRDEGTLSELKHTLADRVGIHLNLSSGAPLTKYGKTLTDGVGQFLDKQTVWRRAMFRKINLIEVEREFTEQINRLCRQGIHPDHLDGHNHIHVFPGIATVVARLANQFGIEKVRLPSETFSDWKQSVRRNGFKKRFFGFLSAQARHVFERHGIRSTEHFAGIQSPEVSSLESLRSFLAQLPEGTTELMCHPGYANPAGDPFSSKERENELNSLTQPAVLEEIRSNGIELISFGDI
jgi:predicted glycoside hydrolase/deacetylase ChbG (UPF0249 family)